ncbi:DNA-binding response regulator [Aliidiomarina iranensis]|uniref:DNA-binding response regulator n=1 Tax=Aliidiomarina iranensis TaxID=1434071 RepID=A0A432VW81_9GAMM|nr:response regulator transcription factor [Aliidiomarina iranensis]RUO20859.1 DNA-binding response regulator [Aliidiomarina iranensis]
MKLLLVEDDKALARVIMRTLDEAGFIVEHATKAEQADFLLSTEDIKAVLLDLGLPDGDGVQLIDRWRRADISVPILVLTARSRWADKADSFTAGADDYLTKPFSHAELVFRLRALLRRSYGHSHPKLQAGAVVYDTHSGVVTRDGLPVNLTAQELRLLSYLLHAMPRVVSRVELVEQVYDRDKEPDSNVIDVQIGRLRRKLGDQFIETLRGQGYRIVQDESQL